jgi:hypothetical protein
MTTITLAELLPRLRSAYALRIDDNITTDYSFDGFGDAEEQHDSDVLLHVEWSDCRGYVFSALAWKSDNPTPKVNEAGEVTLVTTDDDDEHSEIRVGLLHLSSALSPTDSTLQSPVHLREKPYSDHPDDHFLSIVLRENFKGELVTHLYNAQSGGYSNGHYHGVDWGAALADFHSRGKASAEPACDEKVALVFMGDTDDNFFIEQPPAGAPEDWIGRFTEIEQVEHVFIYETKLVRNWSNPNSSPEA